MICRLEICIILQSMLFKEKVYKAALDVAMSKVENINQEIDMQKEVVANETKSSSGDKYETGSAMAQLEQEKLAQQLLEAKTNLTLLGTNNMNQPCFEIRQNALFKTKNGWFYVSAPLGQVEVEGTKVYCLSIASPLARAAIGKQKGETYSLNGKEFEIVEIQ